jgi:hypothetical protein
MARLLVLLWPDACNYTSCTEHTADRLTPDTLPQTRSAATLRLERHEKALLTGICA